MKKTILTTVISLLITCSAQAETFKNTDADWKAVTQKVAAALAALKR